MMKLITALTMMLKAALPMGRVQDVVATYNWCGMLRAALMTRIW
jgi:hypothetical protein